MRVVIQRVLRASVRVADQVVGNIDQGLLVLVGMQAGDSISDVAYLVDKILDLRIFADEAGKMNRSVRDVNGGILIVSQFTLYGDCRKGRRPSFVGAAPPELAQGLYNDFVERTRLTGVFTQSGIFAADMAVELINDGPVTFIIDSPAKVIA
ncbi:D-tyrosyl-tRNA(Tyr) deacylase [bacterium]|nr:D-tyrosyl-tRNA(Tyr) deacylase [bacterium]